MGSMHIRSPLRISADMAAVLLERDGTITGGNGQRTPLETHDPNCRSFILVRRQSGFDTRFAGTWQHVFAMWDGSGQASGTHTTALLVGPSHPSRDRRCTAVPTAARPIRRTGKR